MNILSATSIAIAFAAIGSGLTYLTLRDGGHAQSISTLSAVSSENTPSSDPAHVDPVKRVIRQESISTDLERVVPSDAQSATTLAASQGLADKKIAVRSLQKPEIGQTNRDNDANTNDAKTEEPAEENQGLSIKERIQHYNAQQQDLVLTQASVPPEFQRYFSSKVLPENANISDKQLSRMEHYLKVKKNLDTQLEKFYGNSEEARLPERQQQLTERLSAYPDSAFVLKQVDCFAEGCVIYAEGHGAQGFRQLRKALTDIVDPMDIKMRVHQRADDDSGAELIIASIE